MHRALAPLLRKNLVYDTQVLLTLLASDGVHDPAATCINAASTALLLSQATLDPLAAVRVALVNGEIVVNPTLDETALASAEILYAGNEQGATLINLAAAQASLEDCSMLLRSGIPVQNRLCCWFLAVRSWLQLRAEQLSPGIRFASLTMTYLFPSSQLTSRLPSLLLRNGK